MSLTVPVLISGVFDPLHAGHLAYIRAARASGPVICVLSDAPEKHPPLVPWPDRAMLLTAIGVDRVLIGVSVVDALRSEWPSAYIKGADWRGQLPADQIEMCARLGIQIIYTETVQQSSTALLADYERRRNAEMLARFETFVQEQKPAEKPWEPVTPFDRDTRRVIEAPQADIIAKEFKGCSVLDYGCGFGYLTELLREHGMSVAGWDPHHSPTTPQLVSDLVICREVLEHLTVRQLTVAVRNLVTLSNQFVYVTTRFTAQPHLLDVDGSDDLDPTHLTMLNIDLLRALFVLDGCTRRADLEEKLDWKQLGRVLVYQVPA